MGGPVAAEFVDCLNEAIAIAYVRQDEGGRTVRFVGPATR